MKKFSLLLAILPFLVACGNQTTPKETSSQKTIVVATAGDVPPFDYEDKGNLTGFDIEVLKAVDEKLSDYEIQFQRTAWESIFPGLDSRFNSKELLGRASFQDLILVTIKLQPIT